MTNHSTKRRRRKQFKTLRYAKLLRRQNAQCGVGDCKFKLKRGTEVEIRKKGEREWRSHTMNKTTVMRTTGRCGPTLYMEFLNYQVRFTSPLLDDGSRHDRY